MKKILTAMLALAMIFTISAPAMAANSTTPNATVIAEREANPNWHTWYNFIHEKVNWYKNVDELRALGDWTLTEVDFKGKGLDFKAQHRDTAPDSLAAATVSGCDTTYGDSVATWTYLNNNFDTPIADCWARLLLGTARIAPDENGNSNNQQNGVVIANKYLTYITTQFDTDVADFNRVYGESVMLSFVQRIHSGGAKALYNLDGDLLYTWLITDGNYNACYANFIREEKLVTKTLAARRNAFSNYARTAFQEYFKISVNGTQMQIRALPVVDSAGNTTVYTMGIGGIYAAMGIEVHTYAGVTCYSTSAEGDAANKAALEATVAKIAADKAAADKADADAFEAIIAARKEPEYPPEESPVDCAISYTTVLVNGQQVKQSYVVWDNAPLLDRRDNHFNVTDIGEALGIQFGQEHGDSTNSGEVFVIADGAHAPKQENPPVSSITVTVNGKPTQFEAVVVTAKKGGATTYFKLRDIGDAMGFKVEWTHSYGICISNDAPPVKNHVTRIERGSGTTRITSVTANGVRVGIPAVAILDAAGGATTYFKIRDVATIMGFNVDWSAATGIALSN